MKIYTKTGDSGDTGLISGVRVAKNHRRIEAYGTVDELCALVGLTRCDIGIRAVNTLLEELQHQLFVLGAELATPSDRRSAEMEITTADVEQIELRIDEFDGQLPPLNQFILPGGSRGAAGLHVCRTVCRRAERRVVALSRDDEYVSAQAVVYLNRLSDLFFVLARFVNAESVTSDIVWRKP